MDIEPKNTNEYKGLSPETTLTFLGTSFTGLSEEEADLRIKHFGYNEIPGIHKNPILEFLRRYWGPMPWLLELAIILTIVLGHYTESIIIFVLLTLNAVIGFYQSGNSQKALHLLKSKLEINARILRGGNWIVKEAKILVPGDVILIKLGDLVPADVQILSGDLSVDESTLTGESLPKDLHASDVVFSSSIVKRSEATCVVVNTGKFTYFGKTAELVRIAKPRSQQEKIMLQIVRYMMYLGVAASLIVSVYSFILHINLLLILSFIVVFLIGAIPVALPAVLTIVQAVGALELSKKGVLVTKLDSIEDAASIDIFCFDKTGTLTQNRLTVIESVATGNVESKDVITWAASASKSESMDAIDLAILEFSVTSHADLHDFNQKTYTPFDPANKRTEATVESAGKTFLVIKGAAQTVLSLCVNIDDSEMDFLNKTISRFSQKGYRTIAVARTEKEKPADMRIVGLLALADPIREDSAEMIDQMKRLGIKPILLTGDSIAIAQEISTQAGIGPKIARIADLDKLDVKDQLSFIRNNDGFAEVYPEDKYRIVKLLQNNGHLVGMTGDGVNDSPALKQAELGVAVSGATDVARASASIVLTQPGLGEVVDAIKISRQTYQRMLTWVINKIVKVFEIVILFTVGFFLFHNMVITLLGMSLLVFANDFVTISIATDHVKSTDSPNQWNIKNITFSAAFIGLFFALEDLFIIYAGTTWFHLGLDGIQTLVLLSLVFNSQFRILIVRERKHFWSSFPNKNMLLVNISTVIGFTLLGVFGFIIPAVPFLQIVILIGIALVSLLGIDFLKYFIFHKLIK